MKITLKTSAYQKLSSSPYNGNKPSPLPQQQDQDNWSAFQTATEVLSPNINFVSGLNYRAWTIFNLDSWDQVGSTQTPDRKQVGNWQAVPPSFFTPYGPSALVAYFLQASQSFMNLCDDLKTLATGLPNVQGSKQWSDLLNVLTNVITKDIYLDYGQPAAAALLTLCSEGNAQVSSTITEAQDSSSLSCLVNVA